MIILMIFTLIAGVVKYTASVNDIIYYNGLQNRINKTYRVPAGDTLAIIINDWPSRYTTRIQKPGAGLSASPSWVASGITSATQKKLIQWELNNCPTSSGEIGGRYILPINRFFVNPGSVSGVALVELRTTNARTSTWSTNDGSAFIVGGGCTVQNVPPNYYSPSLYTFKQTGSPDSTACSVPSPSECMQCAYPYMAYPDTVGCGCKVAPNAYQSKNQLAGQCNAYCNSTAINGLQSSTDWSRSNFDANIGPITCACSEVQSQQTVYRPTTTCPIGTNPDTEYDLGEDSISTDSTPQKVPYDPTTNPNLGGGGSGDGTGKYDSLIENHLSRLDSILGSNLDTSGSGSILDSMRGNGTKTDSIIGHDTSAIRGQIAQIAGDTSNTKSWYGGSTKFYRGMDCWTCDTVPDTSIVIQFMGSATKDTLKIGLSPVMTGLGVNFWPWLRYLEYLAVIIAMIPLCMFIMAGTTGKDSV